MMSTITDCSVLRWSIVQNKKAGKNKSYGGMGSSAKNAWMRALEDPAFFRAISGILLSRGSR